MSQQRRHHSERGQRVAAASASCAMLSPMPDEQLPPHQTVEVQLASRDYSNVCETYGGGWELRKRWEDLGDLLAHRMGWHFELSSGHPLWSLGHFGASMLNIRVVESGDFYCFDYAADEAVEVSTTEQVEAWLAHREVAARQPTQLQRSILEDSDWRILRSGASVFDVRVSWSDGWYFATVVGLPEEAVFEKTLRSVVDSVRSMLVRSLGAPDDIGPQLALRIGLDEKASAQLSTD